jgi:[ribosomal protein S5]-alanine N-acetyltransferase
MILETRRLKLRPFRADDVDAVASYSTLEEFVRFLPLPRQTRESAGEFVRGIVEGGQPDAKNDWHFAVQVGDVPILVGTIRIGVREAEHHQGDVGYAMHQDHRCQGYATEALGRILAFGFEHLSLERIWAIADVRNVASWTVMKKAGMAQEGVMRHHRLIRGAWCDSVLYAAIRPSSA